jgi:hypothetical protein
MKERLWGAAVTCDVVLAMVSEKVFVADPGKSPRLAKSVTVTTGENAPAAVGLPVIKPVFGSIERPGDPLASEKVYGGVPPVTPMICA